MKLEATPLTPPIPQHLNTAAEWLPYLINQRWYYWQGACERRGIPCEIFLQIAKLIDAGWRQRGEQHKDYNDYEQHLINAVGKRYNRVYCSTPKQIPTVADSPATQPEKTQPQPILKGEALEKLLKSYGYKSTAERRG